ncbi:alkaline phosphatase family protein [Planctomycetota bacterium]
MGLLNLFRKKKTKRVMVGLDGVPFPMIQEMTGQGIMPRLATILSQSQISPMSSSIPHISSVAWSSLITGKNPGEHGIYGFMELAQESYDFTFPDSRSRRALPFWAEESDRVSVILNVPSTYPVQELNGVLVAGFVAIDLEKATFPKSLVPLLKEFDYRTDTDSSKGHESPELFLTDLNKTFDARIKTCRHLWESEPWDTFMFTVTGTDRLCHFLYEAFENKNHRFRKDFLDYFRKVDEIIGELYERTAEDALFMMFSDHGFGPLSQEVYLNRFLKEKGFLNLDTDEPSSFESIASGTKAFILDPSRVYVHTHKRYPRGEVSEDDYEPVLKDLEQAFKEFEIDGQPVIKSVLRKEEIFSGPCIEQAPDLVLVEHEGFDLKAKLSADTIYGTTIFTGKHTFDNAFLLVRPPEGLEADIPENVTVSDVRRIMEMYSS